MDKSPLEIIARLRSAAVEYERRDPELLSISSVPEAASAAVERLNALGEKICSQRGRPLNLADLENIEPTTEMLGDLRICLDSDDPVVLGTGFFYLNALTLKRSMTLLPTKFLDYLRQRLLKLLDHKTVSIVRESIIWISFLANSVENYRARMLQFLKSSEPAIREAALRCYQCYAKPEEVEPLLSFERDVVVDEIKPMGPWRYSLRDRAFEMVEKHLGRSFPKIQKQIPFQGSTVSWHDWQPILDWYKGQRLHVIR